MKIKDIFEEKEHVISFEIFPPNKNFSEERLKEVTSELIKHKPDFISVTYGAGGTTKSGTIEMSSHIKNNLKSEVLAHLTCVGSKKTEIASFLEEAKNHNIKNIMALRGDIPQGEDESIYEKGDYRYASDLIRNIKETHDDFSIGAAFYPETHYESNDLADIVHLKKKVDEGVDFLVSQVCFDNRMFVDFREKAEKLDIKVPLIAGIMPVTNAAQIKRIVQLCKSSIPSGLEKILDKYGSNPESMKKAGIIYATEQIIELLSYGIRGIHLYTMNKTDTTEEIMNNISFARANMKVNIYDQAVLEGVATSFPQTEEIIDNGKVSGMTATDVQKILNLKHAWEFILDKDVIASTSDYYMLSHIARLVNEGFFSEGGRIRGVPVTIGGSSYVPPLPNEGDMKDRIREITEENGDVIDVAIKLCLYCMKTQILLDWSLVF